MAPENKKRLLLALKILVAAGVIGVLAGSGQLDFKRVAQAFQDGPGWIAMAAVCLLVGICVTALRWYLLLKAQGIRISYWNSLRLTFVGIFFNTFMPGGTGGDLVKAYYVWDSGSKRAAAVTTVFLDRVIGLYA
ncbi:MAG: lysylphosphatidylglycerol synthase transmembrane domain-containing protein, partial [Planctomycetota bacterium]|nr:lysylphosphatidylglycerol synthase transmembrane domain-containing protein [Planctomycetota bacterium]